jgi:cardiolipin synthase
VFDYWPHLTLLATLNIAIVVVVIPLVLLTKKEATSAVAWCLAVLLVPIAGALLFWMFGYNRVHRQVSRKQAHQARYRERHPLRRPDAEPGDDQPESPEHELGRMALRANAFPIRHGNRVALYHDTAGALEALLEAIRQAERNVHLEFFSIHNDETGARLLDLLIEKARAGVEVRVLFDAVGSVHLGRKTVRRLREAGAKAAAFFPLNRLRSLVQVNMRNHRKIVLADGRVAFTGGMNIGDAYLGKGKLGYWRDTFLRVEGPAVGGLQRIFAEDWDFTAGETLTGPVYFPDLQPAGDAFVQVAGSGPDQELNCIREIYFMAMLSARKRLWMASPYFVPDAGLLDALRVARYRGVDVRLLTISKPDHYSSFYAGRYYFKELLDLGVKVYLYQKGMMHSKLMMVDGAWALVGSANLDIRSLRLDFEAGCALFTPALVADLEAAFERDLADAAALDEKTFASRSIATRLLENACRLLAPAL